jgi:hypothetical protein
MGTGGRCAQGHRWPSLLPETQIGSTGLEQMGTGLGQSSTGWHRWSAIFLVFPIQMIACTPAMALPSDSFGRSGP